MKIKKALALVAITLLSHSWSLAQLRLPSWISSGMVIQQRDSTTLSGWAGPGTAVVVQTSWSPKSDTAKVTNLATWRLSVATPAAGGPHRITITSGSERLVLDDIWSGEVWVCSGQSNMEWSFRQGLKDIRDELPVAYRPQLRLFHIPKTGADHPQENVAGKWLVCDSVSLKDFSAVGYFFGKKLQQELSVPIGLIDASWGGTPAETWVPQEAVLNDRALTAAAEKLGTFDWWPSRPAKAYNGMISPLHGHAIAGVIWYQGESNVATASTYRHLMATLVDSWRSAWQKAFPFYFVQIAPYDYGSGLESAMLREAQADLLSHPGTGMVVVSDLVDNIKDIHPVNKHDVGARLAGLALGEHYRVWSRNFRSPSLSTWSREKSRMILTFSDAEAGLVIRGRELEGAVLAGPDGNWHKASGKLVDGRLVLWSKNVREPVAARFGFGNTVIGNLFSAAGLPVAPFRTDRD